MARERPDFLRKPAAPIRFPSQFRDAYISGMVPCCNHWLSLVGGEPRVAMKKSRASLRYSLA
jgi:hypothetical protein